MKESGDRASIDENRYTPVNFDVRWEIGECNVMDQQTREHNVVEKGCCF